MFLLNLKIWDFYLSNTIRECPSSVGPLAGLQKAKRSQKMCFQKTIFGPLPKVKNRF